jgi:hypothetical protein
MWTTSGLEEAISAMTRTLERPEYIVLNPVATLLAKLEIEELFSVR